RSPCAKRRWSGAGGRGGRAREDEVLGRPSPAPRPGAGGENALRPRGTLLCSPAVVKGDRSDQRAGLAALLSAALMIAQQVGCKATRDALFLSSFDAEDLPRVVIASAAASLLAVLA